MAPELERKTGLYLTKRKEVRLEFRDPAQFAELEQACANLVAKGPAAAAMVREPRPVQQSAGPS